MNPIEEAKARLRETAVFREMPDSTLGEIAAIAETRVAPARTVLFRKGDRGDGFWVVESGRVRVFLEDEEGVQTTLAEVGPGESFGEMALLTGEARSAHVETLEESRFLYLGKEPFQRVLQEHPQVSLGFVKQLHKWLIQDDRRLQREIRQRSLERRVSWFDFVLILGLSVLFGVAFNHSNPNGIALFPGPVSAVPISAVDPSEALEEHGKGETLFVDAMPSPFYEQGRIRGAVNIPLPVFEIAYLMHLSEESKERRVIVYGSTISRPYDEAVAGKLLLRGHKNVRILRGGLGAWAKRGYPVEP
ncbi:MAG: cyclic nucleotide-binding domain-containing protein [Deltaproteobacteria bacterium]|nr:cyclic nucleotide-binding domain-containing protein [Deltaproteobacteria bacterium]